jgi:hypothetical protein
LSQLQQKPDRRRAKDELASDRGCGGKQIHEVTLGCQIAQASRLPPSGPIRFSVVARVGERQEVAW